MYCPCFRNELFVIWARTLSYCYSTIKCGSVAGMVGGYCNPPQLIYYPGSLHFAVYIALHLHPPEISPQNKSITTRSLFRARKTMVSLPLSTPHENSSNLLRWKLFKFADLHISFVDIMRNMKVWSVALFREHISR